MSDTGVVVEYKSQSKDTRNRVPISAHVLREKFGSASRIYSDIKETLKSLWKEVEDDPDIKVNEDNWVNAVRILYGYTPDSSLFLDHAYLIILAKIAVYLKFEKSPNRDEILDVMNGNYFTAKGIANFLEEDPSLWLLNPEIEDKSFALFCSIVDALANYDFPKIEEDLFRELYEELVERNERHKAGEYYTPEWLVQLILNDTRALKEDKRAIPNILDPACGSGTFLYRVIRLLIEKRAFLRDSIKNVAGIDVNPIATIFNMPSCVLIGLKDGTTHYPVLSERYAGELPDRNATFSEAIAILSTEVCKYIPPDFSAEPSYYFHKFKVGASIFPRSLYFVDIRAHANSQIAVKTSGEIYRKVKEPWKIVLEGTIEDEFLYATFLAWEIIPFGYINLHHVILPIREHFYRYRLLHANELQGNGFTGTEEWLKKAQRIWCERRTEKSKKRFPDLLDRLNYNHLLTIQNPTKRYVVLYNATGTNLVSCVIDNQSLPCLTVGGEEIKPKGFIVDVKTWFFETGSEMEAYYLSAIFNAELINEHIKPLQPKGLFGARAIHRRPLLLAIPTFNGNEDVHLKLAHIGSRGHEKAKIMNLSPTYNIRAEVRKKLKDEIGEINKIVAKMLRIKMEGE